MSAMSFIKVSLSVELAACGAGAGAAFAVSGAAGVVLGMALAPEPDCRDVGVRGQKFISHHIIF